MKQEKKRSRKQSQTMNRLEAVVLIGVFLVVAGYILGSIFLKPKVDDMQLAPETETSRSAESEGEETSVLFSENKVEYNGKTYRRNTYIKAILCIGVDRSDQLEESKVTGFGGQADGVVLVVQDTARNNLKMVMIPRDTMTMIPMTDLSGNLLGKGIQHLNLAYAYGDGKERSCEYMAEAVSDLLLGLPIDHYLAADLKSINLANDLVGGVTVTVPTDDLEAIDPVFKKGSSVTLMGSQAETFVRYRDIDKSHTALYRMDRQQEYIAGFYKALQEKSRTDSGIVTRLFEELTAHMVTDMGKESYLKMAMDALESDGFSGESIYTLPGQSVSTGAYDEFYPDEDGMIQLILELFYREET